MIKLHQLGVANLDYNKINKRFKRVDFTIKAKNLIVSMQEENNKKYHGLIYLPPLRQEIGNFTLNKTLFTHPWYDNMSLPNGPQVTWFTVYKDFCKKGTATTVYETLIDYFGAVYSDYQQTEGGTQTWIKLAKRKNVDIFTIKWKKDLTFSSIEPFNFQSEEQAKDVWFNQKDEQIVLLAKSKKNKI